MLNPRRAILSFVLASLATFAACTFPEVSFSPGDGGAGGQGTASGGGAGGQAGSDAGKDAGEGVDPDGVNQDAATREDSGIVRPEAGAEGGTQGCGANGGDACDCDGDKVKNSSCKPSSVDCDDFDRLVHPDAGFVAAKWDPTSPHTPPNDWDCDSTVTKQYSVKVSCGLLQNCDAQGFRGDPGCGESGDYIFCKPALILGVACQEDTAKTETRTQGCR